MRYSRIVRRLLALLLVCFLAARWYQRDVEYRNRPKWQMLYHDSPTSPTSPNQQTADDPLPVSHDLPLVPNDPSPVPPDDARNDPHSNANRHRARHGP